MPQHVHHEVIVAYLEGKTVQALINAGPESYWQDYSLRPDAPMPSFSPAERWQIKPVEERRWYVHDRFDTLAEYVTAQEAAKMAGRAAADGCDGIHIIYATEAEQTEYCNSGKFPFHK